MDHVELGLDPVAADVVDRADELVKDQVLSCGWKPAETQILC